MKDNVLLRGEVWIVQLDPAIGSEIKKSRPALIISNDANNRLLEHVTILPITESAGKIYTVEVFLPKGTAGLLKDSKIRCSQIRTLDKSRLVKVLGRIPEKYWVAIQNALNIHLGFI